ncbi:MAG: glycosyltransferase [Ruthenibacterium sp.]
MRNEVMTIDPCMLPRFCGQESAKSSAVPGTGEIILFCHPDAVLAPDALAVLSDEIQQAPAEYAVFELRRLPFESPKYYDPVTRETPWGGGACFAVRRSAFTAAGGFDDALLANTWGCGADTELSFHLCTMGFRARYVPAATYTLPAAASDALELQRQTAGAVLANFYLRCKYGAPQDVFEWDSLCRDAISRFAADTALAPVPALLLSRLPTLRTAAKSARNFYKKRVRHTGFTVAWNGFDTSFLRGGAAFKIELPPPTIRFSVLVRTYRRPAALALTLASIANQTYRCFDVVVVEDGEQPVAGQTVYEAQQSLPITYLPLCKAAGESAASNAAIAAATGDWLVFLDDDDFFFADHLETLAQGILANPGCGLVAAGSVEAVSFDTPDGLHTVVTRRNWIEDSFSLARQCCHNHFSVQSVAFSKDLPRLYGGSNEALRVLDDWDLWTRYACHTAVALVPKCTSVYHVPADAERRKARDAALYTGHLALLEHWKQYALPQLTAGDILSTAWNPQQCAAQQDETHQRELLLTSLHAMRASRRWRLSAPLRALPALLVFVTRSRCAALVAWQRRIGPPALPACTSADTGTLREQLRAMRISLCWRITQRPLV